MTSRTRFSAFLSAFGLVLASCSGKVASSKITPSPDDDLPTIVNDTYPTDDIGDGCEVVDEGEIVVFSLALNKQLSGQEFPIYECDPDGGTPLDHTDGGTTPPPQDEVDGGTPPGDDTDDAGTPPQGGTDGGTPPGDDVDQDAGTPPQDEVDGGCVHHDEDAGQTPDEPLLCNRKITVIVHSGQTTTFEDDVLHCTFTIENDDVNVRVVRSCDKETEIALPKVFAEVGSSGQLKVVLTTPHRCGHLHEL